MHDPHDSHAFGALAALSTILGGALGEQAAAALTALVVSVGGQLLLRLLLRLFTPTVDALGHRVRRRFSSDPAPAAPDVPGRPETSPDVPPAA